MTSSLRELAGKLNPRTAMLALGLALSGTPALGTRLYFDVGALVGDTLMNVPSGSQRPTLLHFGGEASLGVEIRPRLFLGVSADYRTINQYSGADPTVGNRRGTQYGYLAPLVGLRIGRTVFKAQFQCLGRYEFPSLQVAGSNLAYRSGTGVQLTFLFPFWRSLKLGVYGGYSSFSNPNPSPPAGLSVGSTLSLWQAGASLAIVLPESDKKAGTR